MARPIPAPLQAAQVAYAARTNDRVSQTELQRLQWRLDAGDTPDAAAEWVEGFFSLHAAAMRQACAVASGAAAQAAYDRHCSAHGARYGYAN